MSKVPQSAQKDAPRQHLGLLFLLFQCRDSEFDTCHYPLSLVLMNDFTQTPHNHDQRQIAWAPFVRSLSLIPLSFVAQHLPKPSPPSPLQSPAWRSILATCASNGSSDAWSTYLEVGPMGGSVLRGRVSPGQRGMTTAVHENECSHHRDC